MTVVVVSTPGPQGPPGPAGGNYALPAATASTLGGVKAGANLTVASDGTLNAPAPTTPYTLPAATSGTIGGVKIGTNLTVASDGTLNALASGGGGAALSAFYVAPSGYSGAVPTGYTLVTQTSLVARVVMNAGYNIVTIAVGGVGTVNLVVNANPFVVDIIDGDGGLSTVAVNKVTS